MESWRGINLFIVIFVLSSFLQNESIAGPTVVPRLRCYLCYSTTSWEDCEKTTALSYCEKDQEVCVKVKVNKGYINGSLSMQYTKHCAFASYCSDKECKSYGWACKVDCCHDDLCNKGPVIFTHLMLVVVILCLQAIID